MDEQELTNTQELTADERTFIQSILIAFGTVRRKKEVHAVGSEKWTVLHELENNILSQLYTRNYGADAINLERTLLEELNLVPSDFLE